MAVSRDEMETVIIYDNLADKWHVSTDVPKHIRKYLPLLESPKLSEENGKTVYCEGWLNGTVAVSKKRQLTEEQKQAASERLKAIREKQK